MLHVPPRTEEELMTFAVKRTLAVAGLVSCLLTISFVWGVRAASSVGAGCYCSEKVMSTDAAPQEGLLALPTDSCTNLSRSLWVVDSEGHTVTGSIDTALSQTPGFAGTFWRADEPLTPGAQYTYYHVVKDSSFEFTGAGCETTAHLTVRAEAFPEMVMPPAELWRFDAIWVHEFQCYAPRFWLTVQLDEDPALSPYHRYSISLVRGEEANVVRTTAGQTHHHVLEHSVDWTSDWESGVSFQDAYCLRVEAWEIVNGSKTSEDRCVLATDLIGVEPQYGRGPHATVPADALCDASIDITSLLRSDHRYLSPPTMRTTAR